MQMVCIRWVRQTFTIMLTLVLCSQKWIYCGALLYITNLHLIVSRFFVCRTRQPNGIKWSKSHIKFVELSSFCNVYFGGECKMDETWMRISIKFRKKNTSHVFLLNWENGHWHKNRRKEIVILDCHPLVTAEGERGSHVVRH